MDITTDLQLGLFDRDAGTQQQLLQARRFNLNMAQLPVLVHVTEESALGNKHIVVPFPLTDSTHNTTPVQSGDKERHHVIC